MEQKNNLPANLLYNKDHTWVKIEDEEALLGVTETAAGKVKEFVFINLPEKGKKLKKGDVYVSLEAVKWSGHLESPLSGEITEVNEELYDQPEIINQDPYGKGWIIKIKMSNPEEQKNLLTAEEAANSN
jgi:glycine cleavage system H protein